MMKEEEDKRGSEDIPVDEWHESRAVRAAECKKELSNKLDESYKIARELWMVSDAPRDQKEAWSMHQIIQGIRLLLDPK